MIKKTLIILVLILNILTSIVVFGGSNIINQAEVISSNDSNKSNNIAVTNDVLVQKQLVQKPVEPNPNQPLQPIRELPRTGASSNYFSLLMLVMLFNYILILRFKD